MTFCLSSWLGWSVDWNESLISCVFETEPSRTCDSYLLQEDSEQSEYALDGLRQVMAVKSRVVLPYLVPQLTQKPVNTHALSFLSAVAGDALTKHLSKILPALMSALSEKMGTEQEAEVRAFVCGSGMASGPFLCSKVGQFRWSTVISSMVLVSLISDL